MYIFGYTNFVTILYFPLFLPEKVEINCFRSGSVGKMFALKSWKAKHPSCPDKLTQNQSTCNFNIGAERKRSLRIHGQSP